MRGTSVPIKVAVGVAEEGDPSAACQVGEAGSGAADDTGALTRGVSRGDGAAFGVLYERWFGRAYSAAVRLTGRDEAFCLDVVQEAMVRAARRMPPLADEAALGAWLCRVVHRAALDQLRAERRRVARERAASRGERVEADPDLDARIAWIRRRIDELSAEDGALLAARYGRGRTLEQAGGEHGLTGDSAHGRLRRLLERFRQEARK